MYIGNEPNAVGSTVGVTGKNLLVNPNWALDQPNEGGLYTINAGAMTGPDGVAASAAGGGVFKLRRLADPDNASLKCLEVTVATADAAIAGGDSYVLYWPVEGYDCAGLQAGTANAQKVTLKFKFRTNIAGNYQIIIFNSAFTSQVSQFINVPNTVENEYTVTLQMPTSGVWLTDNGVGLRLYLVLADSGGGQANFMSSTANIAYVKRMQLVAGSVAQPYEPLDYQRDLTKAQRYYCKTFAQGTVPTWNLGNFNGALAGWTWNATLTRGVSWRYPVEMRATPTIITFNPAAANSNWRTDLGGDEGVNVNTATAAGVIFDMTTANTTSRSYIHALAYARLT